MNARWWDAPAPTKAGETRKFVNPTGEFRPGVPVQFTWRPRECVWMSKRAVGTDEGLLAAGWYPLEPDKPRMPLDPDSVRADIARINAKYGIK